MGAQPQGWQGHGLIQSCCSQDPMRQDSDSITDPLAAQATLDHGSCSLVWRRSFLDEVPCLHNGKTHEHGHGAAQKAACTRHPCGLDHTNTDKGSTERRLAAPLLAPPALRCGQDGNKDARSVGSVGQLQGLLHGHGPGWEAPALAGLPPDRFFIVCFHLMSVGLLEQKMASEEQCS